MTPKEDQVARILSLLGRAKKAFPDWRIGQIISNTAGPGRHDVFFFSDDDVEKGLKTLLYEEQGE